MNLFCYSWGIGIQKLPDVHTKKKEVEQPQYIIGIYVFAAKIVFHGKNLWEGRGVMVFLGLLFSKYFPF